MIQWMTSRNSTTSLTVCSQSRTAQKSSLKQISSEIKTQVGSGMRGDKRRTYREKDDSVLDHITNMKASYTRILKGEIELLWPNT